MPKKDKCDGIEIVPLQKDINRKVFDCGNEPLNIYFHNFANQNEKKLVSRHFVAIRPESNPTIPLGYYSLSTGAVSFQDYPGELTKGLPRYPVPIARIGRLATDKTVQGIGLGELLLMNALTRIKIVSDEIGINAVTVDAKDEYAIKFYEKYGFIPFRDTNTLFLPIKCIDI